MTDVAYEQDADGTRQALTVYAPAKGGPWPTAVMIHGSGNSRLDQWASSVASRGVVVLVPYWPDKAPWPNAKAYQADVASITGRLACAVRFARTTAERYGGDPERLTLFGWSAGANLASVIAFADPPVSQGCAVATGAVVPDKLVLFDGDWLLYGRVVLGRPAARGPDRARDARALVGPREREADARARARLERPVGVCGVGGHGRVAGAPRPRGEGRPGRRSIGSARSTTASCASTRWSSSGTSG